MFGESGRPAAGRRRSRRRRASSCTNHRPPIFSPGSSPTRTSRRTCTGCNPIRLAASLTLSWPTSPFDALDTRAHHATTAPWASRNTLEYERITRQGAHSPGWPWRPRIWPVSSWLLSLTCAAVQHPGQQGPFRRQIMSFRFVATWSQKGPLTWDNVESAVSSRYAMTCYFIAS